MSKKCNVEIGKMYGRLTVVSLVNKSNSGHIRYLCKCVCSNTVEVYATYIISGHTSSCGCYRKEFRQKPQQERAFNTIENHYKSKAKKKKYSWNLSKEQFRSIIKNTCYWCNAEPKLKNPTLNKLNIKYDEKDNYASTDRQWIKINGIDRLNNNIGYELNNCVPCCVNCNKMKLDHTESFFLNHIQKILSFQKEKNEKK